ncbi:MAG: hypothetical protein IH953_02775 [Chloroflexi bacterium]|nr:hypothetical protein [Chloroflexota bacterium]
MRTFKLVRSEDLTGVSGIGPVAEGVEFGDGRCVLNWLTRLRSIAIYESVEDLIEIHGHGGLTVVSWSD